jgi:hypothetical protein
MNNEEILRILHSVFDSFIESTSVLKFRTSYLDLVATRVGWGKTAPSAKQCPAAFTVTVALILIPVSVNQAGKAIFVINQFASKILTFNPLTKVKQNL